MKFESNNRSSGSIDGDWIGIAILLMIPYVRIIGVFMLLKKARRMFGLSDRLMRWVYLLAILVLCGSVGEIFGSLLKFVLPVSGVVALFLVVAWLMRQREGKYGDYIACIGDSASYSLDALMSEMGVDEKRLRRDIAGMKKKGLLSAEAYIDEGRRLLILRREGKPAPEAARPRPSEEPIDAEANEYREIILEIRALNVAIDDEEVSRKIDRIEEITANIFHLVEQKPERKADIQTFMEYYLPTTLKLLRQYARLEHQPSSGENIASSRARIESILDKLVAGFEKQLDMLFKSDAIDITSDIKVLEKMMEMDGLTR